MATVVPVLQVFLVFWVVAYPGTKVLSSRMTCGTNLSRIGKAMLLYSDDYQDFLPLAGGRGAVWGPALLDWTA